MVSPSGNHVSVYPSQAGLPGYFVFDRYFLYSIIESTQENRIHNIPNHHYFSLLTALPGREKELSSSSSNRFLYLLAITESQHTLVKIRTSKTVTDIRATVQMQILIIGFSLSVHALSGSDTLCKYHVTGKKILLRYFNNIHCYSCLILIPI